MPSYKNWYRGGAFALTAKAWRKAMKYVNLGGNAPFPFLAEGYYSSKSAA
jgi:predicted alpha-1,6-mannanase (GH76 family)